MSRIAITRRVLGDFYADLSPTKPEKQTVAKMIPIRAGSTEKSEGISPINFIRPEM